MPHVQPELREMLEDLEQGRYKSHNFLLDEDTIEDEDTKENNKDEIASQIANSRQRIERRIQNQTPETFMVWTDNPPRYYVIYQDYLRILKSLLAICPRCSNILEEIRYTAIQTEYGTAVIDIEEGALEHQQTDTETNDGYDYPCIS